MTNKFFFIVIISCIFLFSSKIVANEINTDKIIIKYRETKSIQLDSPIKRLLVMNPKIISVAKNETNLKVKALSVGQSSLILWGNTRQHLIIKVIPPEIKRSIQKKRLDQIFAENNSVSFIIDYAYKRNTEGETFNSTNESQKENRTTLKMNSPFLKGSKISLLFDRNSQIEDNKIRFLHGQLSNITWPHNQRYSIFFGEVSDSSGGSFSSIGAIDGISTTPLKIRFKPNFQPLNINFIYGQLRSPEYGFSSNISQYRISSSSYSNNLFEETDTDAKLFKTTINYRGKNNPYRLFGYRPNWTLSLVKAFNHVEDLFFDLSFLLDKKTNRLSTNLGGTTNKTGYNINYINRQTKGQFNIIRDYIPSEALTASNRTPLKKRINNTFHYEYYPDWFANYFDKSRIYCHLVNNEKENNAGNLDKKNDYIFSYDTTFANYPLKFKYKYSDSLDSLNPLKRKQFNFAVSKNYDWMFPLLCSLRYSNSNTERTSNNSYNSQSDACGVFLNLKLHNNLRYSFNYSHTKRTKDSTDETQKLTSHNQALNYSFSLLDSIRGNLNYRYYKSSSDNNYDLAPEDSSSHTISSSLFGNLTDSTSIRCSYSVAFDKRMNENGTEDEVETIFDASIRSKFHTLFGWKPKTEISVQAFYDVNANGKFDIDIDRPFKKLPILVNETEKGITDKEGRLFIGKIKGFKKIVSIPKQALPNGYVFSTSSKYFFSKFKNSKETCLFGFILNTEINGGVFNDVNNNNRYDDEDSALSGVTVYLSSGQTAVTDRRGRYYFNPVPEGEHDLKIQLMSLPIGYRSTSKPKLKIPIIKGSLVTHNFTFQALRILKGTVIIKTKGKAKKMEGIKVQFNNAEKTTRKKGRFKFTKIKPGKQQLIIPLNQFSKPIKNIEKSSKLSAKFENDNIIINLNYSNEPETKTIKVVLEQ